jgi:hypothetical protein
LYFTNISGYFSEGPTHLKQHYKSLPAGHQWLTPEILATQEAKIKRIEVQSQPRQTVYETYFENPHHKKKG